MLKDCRAYRYRGTATRVGLGTVIPIIDVGAGSEGFSAEPSSAVTRSACHSAPMPCIMHAAFAVTGGSPGMNSLWWQQAGFTAT